MAIFGRLYPPPGGAGPAGQFAVVEGGTVTLTAAKTFTVAFAETFTDTAKMQVDIEPVKGSVPINIDLTTAGMTVTMSANVTGQTRWEVRQRI